MYTKVRDNSPWREELTRDWHWQVPFVPLYSNTCPALYIPALNYLIYNNKRGMEKEI